MNNEKTINKTITMIIKEVRDDLTNIINNSQLPPCIMELILSNLLSEVKVISEKQYEVDKAQYESYLKSMTENIENTEDKIDELNENDND